MILLPEWPKLFIHILVKVYNSACNAIFTVLIEILVCYYNGVRQFLSKTTSVANYNVR